MGYKFTLVLSREITDDESVLLQEAGCTSAVFGVDSLPTNADVTVTKMDFDDTTSPTLAEAIESALEAVKKVPELTVPGLTVPAQPAEYGAEQTEEAAKDTIAETEEVVGAVVEKPSAKKTTRTRKTSAKKVVSAEVEPAEAAVK